MHFIKCCPWWSSDHRVEHHGRFFSCAAVKWFDANIAISDNFVLNVKNSHEWITLSTPFTSPSYARQSPLCEKQHPTCKKMCRFIKLKLNQTKSCTVFWRIVDGWLLFPELPNFQIYETHESNESNEFSEVSSSRNWCITRRGYPQINESIHDILH